MMTARPRSPQGRLLRLRPSVDALARERLAGLMNAAYVAGDTQSLPFGGARFDTAFLATMLGGVPDRSACLAEVHRESRKPLLKAGLNAYHRLLTTRRLEEVAAAGDGVDVAGGVGVILQLVAQAADADAQV